MIEHCSICGYIMKKDPDKSMTPDDMMDCQRELKTLIRDEERSILNYRR